MLLFNIMMHMEIKANIGLYIYKKLSKKQVYFVKYFVKYLDRLTKKDIIYLKV